MESSNNHPVVVSYWNDLSTSYSRQHGEACDKLFDYEIYGSLKTESKKEDYLKKSHAIHTSIIYKQPFKEEDLVVTVKCGPVNENLKHHFSCKRDYPLTTQCIRKIFQEYHAVKGRYDLD